MPNEKQLLQCKLKQDIAYELPVLSKISDQEKEVIKEIASNSNRVVFSKSFYFAEETTDRNEAKMSAKSRTGCEYLISCDVLRVEIHQTVGLADEPKVGVGGSITVTGKGLKWIKSLEESGRTSLLNSEESR